MDNVLPSQGDPEKVIRLMYEWVSGWGQIRILQALINTTLDGLDEDQLVQKFSSRIRYSSPRELDMLRRITGHNDTNDEILHMTLVDDFQELPTEDQRTTVKELLCEDVMDVAEAGEEEELFSQLFDTLTNEQQIIVRNECVYVYSLDQYSRN